MVAKFEKDICNHLIAIYERRFKISSDFKQKVSLKFDEKGYKKYVADNAYTYKPFINDAVANLHSKGFISMQYHKGNREEVREVILIKERVNDIYIFLKKTGIADEYSLFFSRLYAMQSVTAKSFAEKLKKRLQAKQPIQRYIDSDGDYFDALKALEYIEGLDKDIYLRNLSSVLFSNSKRLEGIRDKVIEVYNLTNDTIYSADDFFHLKGILKNPNYIFVKGNGTIEINDQTIDLEKLHTSFVIWSDSIDDARFIAINSKVVTTIENLTTFHSYGKCDGLVIYLGGFSNHSKVKLLKQLSKSISGLQFKHFGDIDFGGFSILKHLRQATGLPILPLNMDVATIETNLGRTKKVETNYLKKLGELLEMPELSDCHKTISYLIQNQIILEQEAL